MKRNNLLFAVSMIIVISMLSGCGTRQDASNNTKMKQPGTRTQKQLSSKKMTQKSPEKSSEKKSEKGSEKKSEKNSSAVVVGDSVYDCDIKADQKKFNGKIDVTVGDKYYATQINDWYMYFDQYEGNVVEIEGYYIGEFAPYQFIGRKGPTCPYCQGGYVCFEMLTDEDLSQLKSGKDWIKVVGILRQGKDSKKGPFYYIEVLSLTKMDKVGVGTVSN